MLSLFKRLRQDARSSSPAYDAAVNIARAPHWYRAGAVPDTMDGRFAVLATVLALVTLRIEDEGAASAPASVALTEAFIADMHAQMQQAGFGDPSLGKQVRHLVGSLASRIDRWRSTIGKSDDWTATVRRSLYRDEPVAEAVLAHSVAALHALLDDLARSTGSAVIAGDW